MTSARWHGPRSRAVALLLGYVGLQASGLAHSVVVRHLLCVQHGEAVEVDDAVARPLDAVEHATLSSAPTRSAHGAHAHGDQHCLVSAHARLAAPLPSPQPGAQPVLLAVERTVVARDGAVPAQTTTLHLAPKTSPPA